ncbi:MAG: penicillin acylase family protein [Gammaproteobacteria bacterium]|nr:penicillin acylase family protein [Gammaproteobacteria bacterium]
MPGEGEDAGKIVIYRDNWGIPHIYAPTVTKGLYAMGRAQAQDRPEQLLINLKMAMGEYASIVGEGAVNHDLTHRMFDHYGASERTWDELDAQTKAHMKAFAAGIRDHYAENPDDLPAWWGERKIDVHMVGAFGRYFLYNWSINEAYGDLRRAGIDPGFVPRRHASNQWTVAPSRSASGNAILVADPHLDWWGVTRFWELRVHAGELHGSGVGLPGSPYIGLGHNENVAWAMTTGGPDTADVFELELDPDDYARYRYDDEWREMTTKTIKLEVSGSDNVERTIHFSHHGPVIAWELDAKTPKAYSGRIAYDDSVNPLDLTVHLNFGETVDAAGERSRFSGHLSTERHGGRYKR